MVASSSGTYRLQVRSKNISLAVLSGSLFMGREEIGGIGTCSHKKKLCKLYLVQLFTEAFVMAEAQGA